MLENRVILLKLQKVKQDFYSEPSLASDVKLLRNKGVYNLSETYLKAKEELVSCVPACSCSIALDVCVSDPMQYQLHSLKPFYTAPHTENLQHDSCGGPRRCILGENCQGRSRVLGRRLRSARGKPGIPWAHPGLSWRSSHKHGAGLALPS